MSIVYLSVTLVILFVSIAMMSAVAPGLLSYIGFMAVAAALGIIVILNWADFIIVPNVMKIIGMRFEIARGYTLSTGQDAIIKKVGELYYATGYLTANLFPYEFKQEFTDQEVQLKIANAPDTWERAIANIDFPFKFHLLATGRDIQKARDELEGKRSYQEFQLGQMMKNSKGNDVQILNVQRKINIIQSKMDRLSQGEKSISTIMYIETAAVGVTEKAAIDNMNAQLERLQISMSALDLQLIKIVGRELFTLFNFNFTLPTTYQQASTYFDSQD